MGRVAIIFAILLLPACAKVHIAGECTYVREVKSSYQCVKPDGTLESIRIYIEQ